MKNHKTGLDLNRQNLLEQGILSEENINFYSDIFDFQFKTAARWSENIPAMDITAGTAEPVLNSTLIKTELLAQDILISSLIELAAIIHRYNPGMDFSRAIENIKNNHHDCDRIIDALLSRETAALEPLAAAAKLGFDEYLFLAVNWLKPFFISLRDKYYPENHDAHKERTCPFCGYYPDMSLFSGEKEGRRYLRCGLCENQWAYPRLACAVCGEISQKKLEYFSEEGNDRYRVDACHTCSGYIKSVRLNKLDETENCDLSIENLLTLSFDAEMISKGFSKP